MPVSSPPTFKPAQPPVQLAAGVLTSAGPTGPLSFAAAAPAAATLGTRLAYASPTGGAVVANPAITNTVGRLDVTLPSGNATWASLTAGTTDGQLLVVRNDDAANTLILPASIFGGVIDLNLPPKARTLLYWDATDTVWERTS